MINKKTKSALIGYAFLLPGIISLILFMAGPISYSFVLSFFSYNIFSSPVFVDLENYIRLLFDPNSRFWEFLSHTIFFLFSIPIGLALSLFLALLVNVKLRAISLFRTIYFLPVIASMITVALLWEFILDKDFGLLNSFLDWLGFSKVDWFGNALAAKIGISLMLIWKSAGYNMLIYLAALQGIPEQYYEAMQLDGANRWQRFKNITFPLLAPAHFFLLITSVIGTFQLFGPIYVMTKGGPVTGTWTLIFEVYWKAYQEFEMGYAAAVSWILFLLMLVMTLVQWRSLGRKVYYA